MHGEYTVRTAGFEGPLEALLQLVEKRKLFINDIALSAVADDYVTYTQSMNHLPIAQTANFVVVASTLILIKSRSLLPHISLSEEEEQSIEELQERLALYKRMKELSEHVQARFAKDIIFPRPQRKVANHAAIFSPDRKTDTDSLHESVMGVLGRIPKKEKVPEARVRTVVSLEETIDSIVERVAAGMRLSFRDFSGYGSDRGERVTVIVSFLAVLELVKQGTLAARQDAHFDDIAIENSYSETIETPMYY
jgi:segregation and condensation protein A